VAISAMCRTGLLHLFPMQTAEEDFQEFTMHVNQSFVKGLHVSLWNELEGIKEFFWHYATVRHA